MTITIIIIICILLLVAYIFDLTSVYTKIPSVILLLLLGWGVREITNFLNYQIPDLTKLLPVLGTVGLILIVLEGALELDLNKSKLGLIRKSFLGALVSMFALAFLFSGGLVYYWGLPLKESLVNVIPICIISSSVAISSVKNLTATNKEFVIYESSLSDILGVLFFNFMALNASITLQSFGHFGLQMVIICVVSFFATLGLSFLLGKIDHPIKYAPMIILIILIYGLSEIYHLPALIFILFFGLFLNNISELKHIKWLKKIMRHGLNTEVSRFREIVTEGAFLIRAFFFTLFGYSFRTSEIINPETIGLAIIVSGAIIIVRFIILKISKIPSTPLLFIAPRGLVTILLFFAIPGEQAISIINKSLIIQVIILLAFFMMIGLMFNKKEKADKEIEREEEYVIISAET